METVEYSVHGHRDINLWYGKHEMNCPSTYTQDILTTIILENWTRSNSRKFILSALIQKFETHLLGSCQLQYKKQNTTFSYRQRMFCHRSFAFCLPKLMTIWITPMMLNSALSLKYYIWFRLTKSWRLSSDINSMVGLLNFVSVVDTMLLIRNFYWYCLDNSLDVIFSLILFISSETILFK
jgi:hypothetical protein